MKPEKKGGSKRTAKSQKYEMYETMTPKERATKWFERPAYSIRGDTIGQAKTESVQSSAKRDTKTQ